MNFTFDYYHHLNEPDFYLCNPDERELFPLNATNRQFTLRFNDLSVLSCDIYATIARADGTSYAPEYYDWVATRRLIFVSSIGWFQITGCVEHDDGVQKYKSITAESYQTTFKNKGFFSEERVYRFYNPDDPTDAYYDAGNKASVPSVLGQMYQQLGIAQDLTVGDLAPAAPYADWTVTYVSPALYYQAGESTSIARSFKEGASYGYDWLVNDVENAFGVVVIFDFLNKAIRIKTVAEAVTRTPLLLSFANFINDVEVTESAEDIVTVLSCNGTDLDIRSVNPTGTNYIVDFSYFMDEVNHRWMSQELIDKLKAWEAAVEAQQDPYMALIASLKAKYVSRTKVETGLTEISLRVQDLKNARDKYIVSNVRGDALTGIVLAETVEAGRQSLLSTSSYYGAAFTAAGAIQAYKNPPAYTNGAFVLSGDNATSNATANYNNGFTYFLDGPTNTYCQLTGAVEVDPDTGSSVEYCDGFKRYMPYTGVNAWIAIYETIVATKNAEIATYDVDITGITEQLQAITESINILSYFSQWPTLLRELSSYWIEGDYTDENLAVLETTTDAEAIDLALELIANGQTELAKVSQPRFLFGITVANPLYQSKYKEQIDDLELGKIITIEKREGLWYYPALLEISFNLDNRDDCGMTFANALRLDDWGYTYADMVASSASVSRQVSANWQNITSYAKDKDRITNLIENPLDATLRAAYNNLTNQEFIVDSSGILGRKKQVDSELFEDEQLRMINNALLFTSDGWVTARAALGRITYPNPADPGTNLTAYGLIADTLIGSLVMSEKMLITNIDSSITLDGSGISISHNGDVVFGADTLGNATFKGNIVGGTIAIGGTEGSPNFHVDSNGNVQLNGNITWGVGSSPTQAVYATSALAKPTNGTLYASFPASGTGWHRTFITGDMFGCYTYDGGATWTEPIQIVGATGSAGVNGQTTYTWVKYATSSAGDNMSDSPDGKTYIGIAYNKTTATKSSNPADYAWALIQGPQGAQGATGATLYTWLKYADTPTTGMSDSPIGKTYMGLAYNKTTATESTSYTDYSWSLIKGSDGAAGANGSDATVNYTNVFNALTNNGSSYGCFTAANGYLYINANFINAGVLQVANAYGTVFKADIGSPTVTIGDFTVTKTSSKSYIASAKSYYNDTYTGVYLGTDGIGLGQGAFYVTSAGALYASNATLAGAITATSGTFSNCTINSSCTINGSSIVNGTLAVDRIQKTSNNGVTYIEIGDILSGIVRFTNPFSALNYIGVYAAGYPLEIAGINGITLKNNTSVTGNLSVSGTLTVGTLSFSSLTLSGTLNVWDSTGGVYIDVGSKLHTLDAARVSMSNSIVALNQPLSVYGNQNTLTSILSSMSSSIGTLWDAVFNP